MKDLRIRRTLAGDKSDESFKTAFAVDFYRMIYRNTLQMETKVTNPSRPPL